MAPTNTNAFVGMASKDKQEFLTSYPLSWQARADGGIPEMSIAIHYKGELVFAQGFGKRNRTDPFTKEANKKNHTVAKTVSHIPSVSKSFTATPVGAKRKVDWDKTPPVFPADMSWFRNELPPRVLISQLKHLDMSSKVSPFINYNNLIYAVAGEAAANVAGITYTKLIETKILYPLDEAPSQLCHAYDDVPYEKAKKGVFEEGYMDEIPMADAPAGDIFMNVLDLAK
ncbi:hypothetical protein EC957_003237 [Mortierella hygrophila]|uniref:Uncharacterized protein n=1 Tax=Mortierella hygrophila TaxID=979708 RepID=A0A9P6K1C1_9FUNG|nr:hypothetical protein EC957_003237 [Mortierella hygrophila]